MNSFQPVTKTIWDMDNVLFESEALAMKIMDDEGFDLVTRYVASPEISDGVPLERGYIYKEYPGTSTDKIVEALINKFSLPVDQIKADYNLGDIADDQVAGAVADNITEKTIEGFKQGLKAIPGITQTLERVDRDMGGIENRAGCTTSPKVRMDVSLGWAVDPDSGENANLATLFPDEGSRRISGYDHDNKYVYFFDLHPDWDPASCVIVEDSKSGAVKAKAANEAVRVIGTIAADYYVDKAAQADVLIKAGADIVVTDVRQIPAAIQWMNSGMDLDQKPDFGGDVYTRGAGGIETPEVAPQP